MFDHSFCDSPIFYYHKSDQFAHAALRLEEVSEFGDQCFIEEFKKFDLKPGEGRWGEQTLEMGIASADKDCLRVCAYLFAHSIELLLKGFYLEKIGDLFKNKSGSGHAISSIYNALKEFIEPIPFVDDSELNDLLLKLDEV